MGRRIQFERCSEAGQTGELQVSASFREIVGGHTWMRDEKVGDGEARRCRG